MLPDMSDVLIEWEQPVKLKTVTKTKVNHEPVEVVTVDTIKAVVQVADEQTIKNNSLDWSKEYVTCHKESFGFEIGQFIEFEGKDYKIVRKKNYGKYGYTEVVGEETNRALLVATP